ncbi:MAG: tRNA-dihydrouridine synthase family protein [Nanoarchaeales archaeon]|nr:tRNA-dihydrouridine synthase family protein [Nanoarchaeales archaeon]
MRRVSPAKLLKSNPFVLAPMDDVTDIAFRKICENMGASYSISELTSIDALIRDKVTLARYQRGNLKTSGVQLFGSKPDVFVQAADVVGDNADFIDVNFGCPSATVTGNDSGSMLLKDPKNVAGIISKLVKHLDKPVTAKIRLGYSKMTYMDVAREVEDAGAEVLAVHGRTGKQKYTGVANWDAIGEIHNRIEIPMIGNGDIRVEEDIDKYLGTHCDAMMIGRAAIGNPLIFEQFNHYKKTGEKLVYEDLKAKRKELFMNYLEELDKFEPYNPELKIKKQSMWFFKGVEGVKELRRSINENKKTIPEVMDIVKRF